MILSYRHVDDALQWTGAVAIICGLFATRTAHSKKQTVPTVNATMFHRS